MFKFVTDPIQFQEEYNAIKNPQQGCILFFLGVSRNAQEDAGVTFLEYSAYEALAIKKAKELEKKILAKYPIDQLVLIHRLGVVPVCEVSLLVILASSHRKNMFMALEEVVDLIKRELPIWKKAHLESGDQKWLENHF